VPHRDGELYCATVRWLPQRARISSDDARRAPPIARSPAGSERHLPRRYERCAKRKLRSDRIPTGQVLPRTLDCGGACSAGACASHCPETGDELVYAVVDDASGAATLTNRAHDGEYTCELGMDWQEGGYDCIADPEVGDAMIVMYRRSTTAFCLEGEPITVQVGLPGTSVTECQYDCTR
jgi:hypothetical protein